MTDAVARIVQQWGVERPDLDASPMLVVGRLHRVGHLLDRELRPTFARAGLGQGDFDVLAALRRIGRPYERTAGDLREALMVTSGAITKQVDRLLGQGLVERGTAEHDARVRHVRLTARGLALVDELVTVHLDTERRLLGALTVRQRTQLAEALAVLAEDLEGTGGARGGTAEVRVSYRGTVPELPAVPAAALKPDAQILDVREDDEWEAGHIAGALHVPLAQVPQRLEELPAGQLHVVCRAGGRSQRAAEWLQGNGYDVVNVEGGMGGWAASGGAMVSENGQEPAVI